MRNAKIVENCAVVWREFQGCFEARDRAADVATSMQCNPQVVVQLGILWLKGDRSLEGGDGGSGCRWWWPDKQ